MDFKRKIMIIAGEASGDMHGAHLVRAMGAADPGLVFFGIGGPALRKAGVEVRVDNRALSVVGATEVFSKLTLLLRALRKAKEDLRKERPALLILIDFPDFNLLVAGAARRLGVPVMYYVSPQIWAWRTGRVRTIKRLVDHMVVIFPFEVDFYKRWHVPVTFVGHPLLDGQRAADGEDAPEPSPSAGTLVGLLPGSRKEEVCRLLPPMVEAAEILLKQVPGVRFAIPVAPSLEAAFVKKVLGSRLSGHVVLTEGLHNVLREAALVITASGTVTLEAALAGTPMIVVYKISGFSYWLGKRLIRVKHIALANLMAGYEIVPELIQENACGRRIASCALGLLRDKRARQEMRAALRGVAGRLGEPGASNRAAEVALDLLQHRPLGHVES